MLSSIAAEWPRAALPKHEVWTGHRFTLDRFLTLLTGALSAFLLWIAERYEFSWLTSSRLLLDNIWRARTINRVLLRHEISFEVRTLVFILRIGWIVYVRSYVPIGKQLLIDSGVSRFLLGAIAAWIEYLLSDCPPGKAQASWIAHFDATLGLFIFAYGITFPSRFISIIYKMILWTFVLVANWASEWNVGVGTLTAVLGYDISAVVSPFFERLPFWLYWSSKIFTISVISTFLQTVQFGSFNGRAPFPHWSRVPGIFIMKLMSLVEVYEYLEVVVLEYIPRSLQRSLYRYQKEQRQIRGVPDYRYRQLKPGEIRLLILNQAALLLSGTLEARMIHVPISSALEYEAVSYRWGEPALVEEVIVEGSRLRITSSAFEVLLAHRSNLRERVLWIDAICINQKDNHEKSEQVRLMCEIYKTASRVILFPRSDWRARLAVGLIYQHGLGPPAGSQSAQLLDAWDLMMEGRPKFAPRWEAMARLLSHEYFNRAWIVQEIAVPQKVELCLGGIYVPWDIFYRAVLLMQQPANISRLHNEHFYPPIAMLHFHDVYFLNSLRHDSTKAVAHDLYRTHAELTELESVLYITSDFRASDPRDKVYAILGLVNESESNLPIYPDYTIPAEQVFEKVANYLFCDQVKPSINILTFAGCGYPDEERLKQSWIPHLLQKRTRVPYTNLLLKTPRFRACGETDVKVTTGSSPGSLSIQGRLCDTILAISTADPPTMMKTLKEEGMQLSSMYQLVKFINIVVEFIHNHPSTFPDHPPRPETCIWHALTADTDPDVTENEFQAWLSIMNEVQPVEGRNDTGLYSRVYQKLNQNPGYLRFMNGAGEACAGRCFAVTRSGRLCLIPPDTKIGDVVFIPGGAQTPYIFRRLESEESNCDYILVGEAYVQGIMRGEMMADTTELTTITVL